MATINLIEVKSKSISGAWCTKSTRNNWTGWVVMIEWESNNSEEYYSDENAALKRVDSLIDSEQNGNYKETIYPYYLDQQPWV